jgi:hypothetical protein
MADPQSIETGLSSDTVPAAWDVLDNRTVDQLLLREGAPSVIGTLINETPTPAARADALVDFAIAGNIPKLAEQAGAFRAWTEGYGLKRLTNALIELDRVLSLPTRGIAILEAQALTRFIHTHVTQDVEVLRKHITEK